MKRFSSNTATLLVPGLSTMAGLTARPVLATDAATAPVVEPIASEFKVGSPFSDHMVLPRAIQVPVWGVAAPGAQ